jgi:hypothetical protein
VELDLRRKGYRSYRLDRVMDIILAADRIYRTLSNEAQKRKNQQGKKPAGTDGLRSLVEGRRGEMERGTKAG